MFTTARNRFIGLAAATGVALLCAPAQARSFFDVEIPTVAPTVAVNYADLDLTTDAGVQALYRRLQVAAKRVCRSFEGREIGKGTKRRACYDQALSDAVTKVNLEMLSALHKNASARPRVS